MFSVRQPIELVVPAHRGPSGLELLTVQTLLRYVPVEGHPYVAPTFRDDDACADVFRIALVGATSTAKLLELTLDGEVLTNRVARDPDDPVFVALLDQTPYPLTFKAGLLAPLAGDPPSCEPSELFITVYVKLILAIL